jgi:hypothetical protein
VTCGLMARVRRRIIERRDLWRVPACRLHSTPLHHFFHRARGPRTPSTALLRHRNERSNGDGGRQTTDHPHCWALGCRLCARPRSWRRCTGRGTPVRCPAPAGCRCVTRDMPHSLVAGIRLARGEGGTVLIGRPVQSFRAPQVNFLAPARVPSPRPRCSARSRA